MLPKDFLIFLLIGTICAYPTIFLQARRRSIKIYKTFLTAIILTIVETIGVYLMFYVENGIWGGRSFYGAVFFVPVAFMLVSVLMRTSYEEIMDMCAPGVCVMLILMKVLCVLSGCCGGRVLFTLSSGKGVVFPSQIVELTVALVILAVLLFAFKKKNSGVIYPWFMILYGTTRFVLNFLREEWAVYDDGMIPPGTIWSVVAVVIGLFWLKLIVKNQKVSDLRTLVESNKELI